MLSVSTKAPLHLSNSTDKSYILSENRYWNEIVKRILALFGCLFIATVHAAPATTTYDVEVVVFENRLPQLEGSELWTRDNVHTPIADLADAITAAEAPAGKSNLSVAATALERDGSYRVLVYQHWRQTADEKSATKPVRLRNTDGQLDGTLRFYLSRFLHVDLDLALQEKGAATGELSYRLIENRRIKTQELNYFDHPKFGVLLRVTSAGKE